MTTTPPLLKGQKRSYIYKPLELDSEQVYSGLSVCGYAAARALYVKSVVWDREDDSAMTITFSDVADNATYTACCSQYVADNTDFDEEDPRSLERFLCATVEWEYSCVIKRESDGAKVGDTWTFSQPEGRKVIFADIRPALEAIFDAVWYKAERIARSTDPTEC